MRINNLNNNSSNNEAAMIAMEGKSTAIKDLSENKKSVASASDNAYVVGGAASVDNSKISYENELKQDMEESDENSTKETDESGKTTETSQEEVKEAVSKATMISEELLGELENEGISIESFTAKSLERAIARIVSGREFSNDCQEKQIENKEKSDDELDKQIISKIKEELKRAMINPDNNTAKSVAAALEMSFSLQTIGNDAIANVVRQGLEPTIKNVYSSYHAVSAVSSYEKTMNEASFAQLKGSIDKVINDGGFEVNDYYEKLSVQMINEDVALTSDNLKLYDGLVKAKDNYDVDDILGKIISNVGMGGMAADTFIAKDAAFDNLDKIEQRIALFKASPDASEIAKLGASRSFNEIRLAMNSEASIRMAVKNIDVDTKEISSVIDDLNRALVKMYAKDFEQSSDSKQAAMSKAASYMETELTFTYMRGNRELAVSTSFELRREISISGVENAMMTRNALERYDESATQVRRDLGDSMQKAFAGIDELLNEVNMPVNQDNEAAVRMLAYSRMEINEININLMRELSVKFDSMIDSMTPAVTKEMLEQGINPLDMTIDELYVKANEIKEKLNTNEAEDYARFLVRMDNSGNITEEVRKSYIGVYRLINTIEKSDKAAISTLVKAGGELTLNNLLTALRTLKRNGMDYSVDDSFSGVNAKVNSDDRIDSMISAASVEFENLKRELSPALIEGYEKETEVSFAQALIPDINEFAKNNKDTGKIRDLSEADRQFNELRLENLASSLSDVSDVSDATNLLNTLAMPATIGNIVSAGGYTKNNSFILGLKNNEEDDDNDNISDILPNEAMLDDIFADKDSLEKSVNGIYESVMEVIENRVSESEEVSEVMRLAMATKSLGFSRAAASSDYYEIPLSTDAGITNIKFMIAKESQAKGQVSVLMNSEATGEINASFKLTDSMQLKGFIACETRVSYDYFASQRTSLINALSAADIDSQVIDYGMGKRTRFYSQDRMNASEDTELAAGDTQMLLQVAKITIRHIMKGIGEINEN